MIESNEAFDSIMDNGVMTQFLASHDWCKDIKHTSLQAFYYL